MTGPEISSMNSFSTHFRPLRRGIAIFLGAGVLGWAGGISPLLPPARPVAFPYDDGSWRMPLERKAAELEAYAQRCHNIDGLYPSAVTLTDGAPDFSPAGHADVSHAVVWSSYYFTGALMRWQVTKTPADEARMRELFGALVRCEAINGVPGLISRGWLRGHGATYEERRGDGRGQERWWQGKGAFADLRWRGSPSHHNYSAYLRALGVAWLLAPQPDIREEVRRLCREVGEHVYAREDLAVTDADGVVTARLLDYAHGDRPTPSVLMVTAGLKVIATVTGDERYGRRYEELARRYDYRGWGRKPVEELRALIAADIDHDDAEHAWGHLFNMVRLERDPELLAFYRSYAEAMWLIHRNEGQIYYNAMYHAITGKEAASDDALAWLRSYPVNRFIQPRVNSVRTDLGERRRPLPLNERPMDNEWNFKGDPWILDGWQTRAVTTVVVSVLDPQVRFAADSEGYLYRSLDGGRSWADAWSGLGGARVRAVALSPRKLEFVLVATDRGLLVSRDGGLGWTCVQPGNATALAVVPGAEGQIAALIDGQPWLAPDQGADYWALTWRAGGCGRAPMQREAYLTVSPAGLRFFAQDERGALWTARLGGDWEFLGRPFGGRTPFAQIAAHGDRVLVRAAGKWAGLAVSDDGGRNWRVVGRGGGMPDGSELNAVAIDWNAADTLYVGTRRGCWVSRDLGQSWSRAMEGLEVRTVLALSQSPATGELFAGTLGGLYVSTDRAGGWRRGNLVPMFSGVQLVSVGPGDFLVGYWSARYTGLLTEAQIRSEP